MENGYDYFGARYYDARVGRWGQLEPLLDAKLSLSPYTYCSDNPLTRIDMSGLDDIYYLEGNRKGKPTIIPTESPDRFFIEHSKGNLSSNAEGLKGKGFFEVNDWQSLQVYFESKGNQSIYESKDVVLNWNENGFNSRFEDAIPYSWDIITPNDIYAADESRPGGNMDQKQFLSGSNLYVFGNTGYNNMEAGNIVWGAVMNYLHSGLLKSVAEANMYTRIAYGHDDHPNEQIAIETGWKYFENSGKERRLTIYGK